MVTSLPADPTSGSTAVTTGPDSAALVKVKALARVTSAARLQRRVSGTVAGLTWAGVDATRSVGPFTIAARAGMPSRNGQQPLAMFVPVILTSVLPATVPKEGVTFERVAAA